MGIQPQNHKTLVSASMWVRGVMAEWLRHVTMDLEMWISNTLVILKLKPQKIYSATISCQVAYYGMVACLIFSVETWEHFIMNLDY